MMKQTTLVLGVLLTLGAGNLMLAQTSNPTTTANQLYNQGLQAVKQGQVDTARQCFEAAVRMDSSHANARYQLLQLPRLKESMLAKKRELELQAVTVPSVDFDESTLAEALSALDALVQKETDGKFIPNFLVRDPDGILDKRTFSLKLGKVPATQVLKYALESTNATVRYDEHAIVIQPIGKKKAEPEAAAENKKTAKPAADPFGG